MPSLLETQNSFVAALLDTGRATHASTLFRGPAHRTQRQLGIYRGNLHANWGKALTGAYPVVRKIVGDEFFESLSRAYAKMHPSTSGDLNDYGARLADFLAQFPHTADLPYLPDVARMEWLAHRAYYAADRAHEDPPPGVPSGDSLDNLGLCVAPGCAILSSPWPLARIWETHQHDYDGDISIDFAAGPETVVIYRRNWKAVVRVIKPADARLLAVSREGATLGEALEAALVVDPSLDPGTTISRLAAAGVTLGLAARNL